MTRLRIKLELNPGGDGIRLDKLANISGELEKFLRNLAVDCGVTSDPGEWVAREFYDGSMGAVVEHVRTVDPAAAVKFNAGVRKFANFQPERDVFNGEFSESTIRQFVEIGAKLDTDEIVKIGLYDDFSDSDISSEIEWEQIAKRTTIDVEDATLKPIYYIGSIQGRLGTWFKESDFIYLRDAVFGVLVRCNYRSEMYDTIYRCYKDKNAVIHVHGRIKSDRLSGNPKEINVEKIERFDRLSNDEFEGIFGSDPNFTKGISIDQFLNRMRSDGDT